MTLESVAWREVHVDPPTGADGEHLLVYGRHLCGDGVGGLVWFATLTAGGNFLTPDGYAIEGVTHWAPMPTGAAPR